MTIGVMFITVLFALIYWSLTVHFPGNGLIFQADPAKQIGFLDALYYSIVTQTTFGAADIQPTGYCRALICVHVFVGLVMGGFIVAKLTSIRGREFRLLAHRIGGDWIETCQLPNGMILFAFVSIYASEESLRYDGESYDLDGSPLGFFKSELINVDNQILRFAYSNRDSNTTLFTEGTVTLRFVTADGFKPTRGLWSRYQATALDFASKDTITYQGVRAKEQEIAAFHFLDHDHRVQVIQKHMLPLQKRRARASGIEG